MVLFGSFRRPPANTATADVGIGVPLSMAQFTCDAVRGVERGGAARFCRALRRPKGLFVDGDHFNPVDAVSASPFPSFDICSYAHVPPAPARTPRGLFIFNGIPLSLRLPLNFLLARAIPLLAARFGALRPASSILVL